MTDLDEIIKAEGNADLWYDSETEYVCNILRHPKLSQWLGYVQVDKDHPAYGKTWDELGAIAVHGGVTFSGDLFKNGDWYVGFDCAHYGDLIPRMAKFLNDGVYRDKAYVKHQCTRLAWQLYLMTNDESRPSLHLVEG